MSPGEEVWAAALGGLRPVRSPATAYDVWYQAGVEAGRRQVRVWRAAAGGAAAAAVALAVLPWIRPPAVVPVDRLARVAPAQAPPPAAATPASPAPDGPAPVPAGTAARYLAVRDAVVRDGWDGLPVERSGAKIPDPARSRAAAYTADPSWPLLPFDVRG